LAFDLPRGECAVVGEKTGVKPKRGAGEYRWTVPGVATVA
jgi:hypothetical protein